MISNGDVARCVKLMLFDVRLPGKPVALRLRYIDLWMCFVYSVGL